jgi:glutathione gamma-glutamylcysteinyltransferase
MRPLPDTLIKMSSPEGKVLFREALALGGMEGYFALAENFITQAEPSYCSVSTLTMVLNAMSSQAEGHHTSYDSQRASGYISEPELNCKLEDVEKNGMTLAEFVLLAQQHGARFVNLSFPLRRISGLASTLT